MEIKTSYDQTEKTGLDALSGLAETTSCKAPNIVPIYPVRIAFADIYGESDSVEYPSSKASLEASPRAGNNSSTAHSHNSPTSSPATLDAGSSQRMALNIPAIDNTEEGDNSSTVENKKGYTLRMLREGYVYIYDGLEKVWSIFIYSPNGSLSGKPETFAKLQFDNADNDWVATDERSLETVYVPNSADEIWIAYSEHRWSQSIFEKAQKNQSGFRDNVMTKLNVLDPKSSKFSDNLDCIGSCVEDFTDDGILHSHEEWNILSDLSIKAHCADDLLSSSSITKANSPAIIVALHDPVGVVKEITMAHTNKVLAKNQYLESITYPLTTAKAVETFMKSAERNLKKKDISSSDRDMFEEWQQSVNPEYKEMIEKAETNAKDYDDTLQTILDTWKVYYEMGDASPESTPGSLQTHLTTFDDNTQSSREVQDLMAFASATVGSLSSSKLGQDYVRNVVVSETAWKKEKNTVQQTISIVSQAMSASSDIAKEIRKSADAASNLMTDLAMPFALEIEELNRIDLLNEVNQFQNGIINKTTTKVEVPIDRALHEIFHGNTRTQQSTIIQKGFRINRNQVNTGVYKFDGEIHVARTEGYDEIKHKVGSAGAAGFALFANALNIVSLSQPQERGQLQGHFGRIAGNRTALILASVEGLGKIFDIPNNYALDPIGKRYFVRGQLRKNHLQRLLKGTDITDDFIKTVTAEGHMTKAPAPPASSAGSRLLKTVVKIGNIAGVVLSLLDLFKAYEAYKRGDNIAAMSMAATGLGALALIAAGTSIVSTGVGVAIGVVLLLIGFGLSWFVDDPVTRWLKNGFWGTTDDYLYWDDKDRDDITDIARIADIAEAQTSVSLYPPENYEVSRYFEREMQEYYELIYWPQKELPPAEIKAVRKTSWFGGTTTKTASPVKGAGVRFRLPGFVDGLSELDSDVFARLAINFQNPGVEGYFQFMDTENVVPDPPVHSSLTVGYVVVNVTKSFKKNLRVVNEASGLLESNVSVKVLNNIDNYGPNDVYWDIDKVAFGEGWKYFSSTEIKVPIYYEDYLWSDGWEVEGFGGKKIVRIR